MRATCCAAFCQVDSSPERKRHWVGRTWPVSMYASGLSVAAAPSGRIIHSLYLQQYGGGTSITFPGWTTVFFRPKKKDPLWHYVESAFWKWKELALYYEKGGRVFLPQRCGCQEPKPTGSLQSNTLLLYKTSSRRSKKIMYKAMFLLTKIQQKIYTPEK